VWPAREEVTLVLSVDGTSKCSEVLLIIPCCHLSVCGWIRGLQVLRAHFHVLAVPMIRSRVEAPMTNHLRDYEPKSGEV
jgi:hypothetical protein